MVNKAFRIALLELEEYFSFPILEFLVISGVLLLFFRSLTSYTYSTIWDNVTFGLTILFVFLIFIVGTIISRSFGGSLSKGEIKILLSYPLKRSELFIGKFGGILSALLIIYGAVFALNIPMLALSPFDGMFYVALSSLFIQIIFVSTVSLSISLIVKKDVIATLASILLLFGIESIAGSESPISANGRFHIVFNYFKQTTLGSAQQFSFQDVLFSIVVPLIISLSLFLFSWYYFTHKMEVD